MKVWTNTQFEGHYPVGVVAVAVTKDQAAHMLNDQLEQRGLSRSAKADQFDPVVTSRPAVVIMGIPPLPPPESGAVATERDRRRSFGVLLCELIECEALGPFTDVMPPALLERWQNACDEHIANTLAKGKMA